MQRFDPTSRTIRTLGTKQREPVEAAAAPIFTAEELTVPNTSKSNDTSANPAEAGSLGKEQSSPSEEYLAYDVRSGIIFRFRRLNKYVILKSIPFGTLRKISFEDFDEFFEGIPEPIGPLITRIR